MKRLFFIVFLSVCLFSSTAFAACTTSSNQTASALIHTGRAKICSIIFNLDGTNNVTVNLYDGTSASGRKLLPTNHVIKGTLYTYAIDFADNEGAVGSGIYVSVSVAGGGTVNYLVNYETR